MYHWLMKPKIMKKSESIDILRKVYAYIIRI